MKAGIILKQNGLITIYKINTLIKGVRIIKIFKKTITIYKFNLVN